MQPQTQQREPKPPFPKQHQRRSPGLESQLKPRPHFEAPMYRPAGKLMNKIALVTGGDSGIGRAVAYMFAREGADVAITYLKAEKKDALETQKFIESVGRQCLLLEGDLKQESFCKKAVSQTVRKLGGLDVLVSNAAHQRRKENLEELSAAEWDKTFRTNVYAYFHLAKAAIPHMKPGSSIIATSSETSFLAPKELPDYSSTKGAINAFTKSLAQMLVDKGIRVNAVAPGPVWTPLNPADQGTTAKKVAKFGKQQAMKRPAQPEELAPSYVFLASEADSSYINGIILPVMGGTPF